ncbi:trypsin Inhibitor like cysteine rich domain protein, partial [Ancylostoma duodenale]
MQNILSIQPCTLNCLPPRCQCQDGFVREGSKCILPEQCPNRQHLKPTTQSYVDEPLTPPSLTCQTATIQILCVEGYHCEIVGDTPQCIPNKKCPKNEEFKQCTASCEPTCGNPDPPCTDECGPAACECLLGFVRSKGGNCIPKEKCAAHLPASNKARVNYVPPGNSQPAVTCATTLMLCRDGTHCEDINRKPQCVENQLKITPPTCASSPGLCPPYTHCEYRDGRLQCIKDKDGAAENVSPCANVKCPPDQYCEFYQGKTMCVPRPGPCAAVRCAGGECVEYDNTFGCFNTSPCAAAFCAGGQCIEYGDKFGCFNTTCGVNEEFKRTSEPNKIKIQPCLDICLKPACQCVAGYVRDNGKCIKRSQCNKDSESVLTPKAK